MHLAWSAVFGVNAMGTNGLGGPIDLLFMLVLAVILSASTGLRAFLPIFIVSSLAYFFNIPLNKELAFLASSKAVMVFGLATLIEVLSDKIPALDHILDTIHTFIKPALSVLATAAILSKLDPLVALVIAIALSGSVTLPVHAQKAALRGMSTLATKGLMNPILSLIEDIGATVMSVVAVFATVMLTPILVASLLGGIALLLTLIIKKKPAESKVSMRVGKS